MAYLTKSNSAKIIARIDFKKVGDLEGDIYIKPIYFFNNFEKNKLLGFQRLLQDPGTFLAEYYQPVEIIDNYRYVFEGNQPAYHATPDCKRLISNYKNFEIPDQIREKGQEKVKEFRSWFKENQYLLDDPAAFTARLHARFDILINPKAIDYENSGVEVKENLNLEQLEAKIDKHITDAGLYYRDANDEKRYIIKRFQKNTYLAYSKKEIPYNDTRFSDDAIKKFLQQYDEHFKKPVIELLTEYYRVKYNPDLQFQGFLLDKLGFRPCASCHNTQ